jgi:hypothetical protein
VGNRVDEIRKSDSSKFYFWNFYSIVNTSTKKKTTIRNPLLPASFSVHAFKVKISEELLTCFCCGRVNFGSKYLGFLSDFVQHIYILVWKVFSQLFNDVHENFIKFVFFRILAEMLEKRWNFFKIPTFLDRRKNGPKSAKMK